jgi:hypothetical protein
MILIHRTFEIVTPESAEHGDAAERGFIVESVPYGFRELVQALKGGEPSAWPARGDVSEWVTFDQGETREWFEHGEREFQSIHYARENAPRAARYWRLAFKAAGLAK